jgi:mannose/fructose-specific phosphotransferase system component IIA
MSDLGLRGVVVGHGRLADGLISAVREITGIEDGVLLGLSNEGLSPDGIRQRLDELLGGAPGVIFADLRGGSCGVGARKVCLGRPERLLITGANLPVLLDFVTHRDLPLRELAVRLVERGRDAVAAYQESP